MTSQQKANKVAQTNKTDRRDLARKVKERAIAQFVFVLRIKDSVFKMNDNKKLMARLNELAKL